MSISTRQQFVLQGQSRIGLWIWISVIKISYKDLTGQFGVHPGDRIIFVELDNSHWNQCYNN